MLNIDVMSLLALICGWHRFRLSYIHSCKWKIHKCIC